MKIVDVMMLEMGNCIEGIVLNDLAILLLLLLLLSSTELSFFSKNGFEVCGQFIVMPLH
jgi:hypothetical protein